MARGLTTAFLLVALAACGGSSGSGGSSTPVVQAPSSASAAPSAQSSKAVPLDLCDAIDVATIDSTLGLKVNPGLWDGSHNCVFVSNQPKGGLTLDRLTETVVTAELSGALNAGTASSIPGLGKSAAGGARTGMSAPAPPTDALVLIDLGTDGLSIHASGPAITLEAVVMIAHDIVG